MVNEERIKRLQKRKQSHEEVLRANNQETFKRSHKEWETQKNVPKTAVCMVCHNTVDKCKCSDHLKPHFMTQISNFK